MRIGQGSVLEFDATDPGTQIRNILAQNRSPHVASLPPFTGGLVGYFSYDYLKYAGPSLNLNLCIAIRSVFKKNGKVFVRAGAGIVAESVPANEYQETINKAKAVRLALEQARGGID